MINLHHDDQNHRYNIYTDQNYKDIYANCYLKLFILLHTIVLEEQWDDIPEVDIYLIFVTLNCHGFLVACEAIKKI